MLPKQKKQWVPNSNFGSSIPELGNCLFKQARPDTGEDWAEKMELPQQLIRL